MGGVIATFNPADVFPSCVMTTTILASTLGSIMRFERPFAASLESFGFSDQTTSNLSKKSWEKLSKRICLFFVGKKWDNNPSEGFHVRRKCGVLRATAYRQTPQRMHSKSVAPGWNIPGFDPTKNNNLTHPIRTRKFDRKNNTKE